MVTNIDMARGREFSIKREKDSDKTPFQSHRSIRVILHGLIYYQQQKKKKCVLLYKNIYLRVKNGKKIVKNIIIIDRLWNAALFRLPGRRRITTIYAQKQRVINTMTILIKTDRQVENSVAKGRRRW